MKKKNIHILIFLSLFPETYSYSLSMALQSGLPIVYLNRGALTNRLRNINRAFPANQISDLTDATFKAINYVIQHSNFSNVISDISTNIQPAKWYLLNYPTEF